MSNFIPVNKVLEKELKNKEFQKEYENLNAWFELQKKLIAARIKSKKTQSALALELGIKQSQLARFETKLNNPSFDTLIKYAKAVGLKKLRISL
ncbi:helix-turn-helix domain-containing protein [Campylobacter helveticus]|uniref:Helix-turn-helix transcriptional regulator n=1 Tax=Campylobacter helveticus TaxID=28898 RepID=A0AAX2UG19_9BACT|nr:helix-turn-helix transcriptional regulator [Campylobacter helveticus]ARE80261.1 putative transcriptional regulator, XRE family [Campylobacter helveticus]MCR2040452.1 helix-turn-helix domain-containing protein [Campylobacter helveticus]MCR2055689.1 helix-turn-helix domain-containing protein [Campylobacter helveticus]TNB54902.1 helix-turn-helix transcriptional regulator [Campylobacter helveticus]TNB55097.1 helix-turn-helix transcriptional regulator [Campylobacter helveticus]